MCLEDLDGRGISSRKEQNVNCCIYRGLLSILLKMALSFNDIRDAPIKSANESKHRKQHISVFDMEFKHRCLQSDVKANKEVFKDLPAYALLSNDQKASLSSDFTICSSASKESPKNAFFIHKLALNK